MPIIQTPTTERPTRSPTVPPVEASSRSRICMCPRIYLPLCCDGETYSNSCLAECNGVAKPADEHCNRGSC